MAKESKRWDEMVKRVNNHLSLTLNERLSNKKRNREEAQKAEEDKKAQEDDKGKSK